MSGPWDMLKQAAQAKEAFKRMQNEMSALQVTGEAGAGLVQVDMNGRYQTLRIFIDESLLTENKKILEELVQAANCHAATKVEQAQKEKMASLIKDFGLPLNMNLPFMTDGG